MEGSLYFPFSSNLKAINHFKDNFKAVDVCLTFYWKIFTNFLNPKSILRCLK